MPKAAGLRRLYSAPSVSMAAATLSQESILTLEDMQARLEQLEATVTRLETHARHADGIIALLLGVVAEASGLELDLDIDKDDLPGANHDWLEYILERFEMGREANEG